MSFSNEQWKVTDYGIEAIVGSRTPSMSGLTTRYEIQAERLVETTERSNGTFYDWPVHMAEKTWVDVTTFNEAFAEALELHKGRYSPAVDLEMLDASISEAQRIGAERY